MILTDDFVYIHMPKTAGTFVARMLARLYGEGRYADVSKHGTCSDIPASHAGKPIVATLRNPYERYVSQYRFGWWRLHPERYCGEAEMRRLFPHYPDLAFSEFLELANSRFLNCFAGRPTGFENRRLPPEDRLGWQTEQFVRFFFRHPRRTFARIDDDYIAGGRFDRDRFAVRFLAVEDLNRQLFDFLADIGHDPADLEPILTAERVLPAEGGRPEGDRWQSYYTREDLELVRRRERLLFAMFPQHDLPAAEILGTGERQ